MTTLLRETAGGYSDRPEGTTTRNRPGRSSLDQPRPHILDPRPSEATLLRETAGGYSDRPGRPDGSTASPQRPSPGQPRPQTLDPRPTEATLAHLWAGQRFPASAFVTRQGVPLRVLRPGRRGRGAGPDFRDALVAAPSGALLRGDVELHVRASDFRRHGHDQDPRYDGVVLHVVFEDDVAEDTSLANGRRVPVVALAPWARRRATELAGWLAGPQLWREPCHDAVPRLGRDEVLRALATLGRQRFDEREAVLAGALRAAGPAAALYEALLSALGYGGERALLESLAERLPWSELEARLASAQAGEQVRLAETLLLGAAGLLHWQGEPARERAALRPANQPARRLAGLAHLIARHLGVFAEGVVSAELLAGPSSKLVAAWTVAGGASALIGRGRAIELLLNAVLPWAAACAEARGDGPAADLARASFARLPRPGRYGALAFLEANFRADGRPLPLDACGQQGLLALYKAECTQGGCGRCVFS